VNGRSLSKLIVTHFFEFKI